MTIPNILTLFRILLTPVFLIFLFHNQFTEALVTFFLAGLTDGLDGFIARAFKQKSLLGAFLDPVADKILLVSAFLALASLNIMPWWLAVVVIVRDLAIITGASLLVLSDVPFEVKPSIAGKITTLFQLLTVVLTLSSQIFHVNRIFLWTLFLVSTIMTVVSGWDYTKRWLFLWKTNCGLSRLAHRFTLRLLPIWHGKKTISSFLKVILTLPYLSGIILHRFIASRSKISAKSLVISIGSLTVGGTGKTPFAMKLARILSEKGLKVAIVTKCLGRFRLKKPEKIEPKPHAIEIYGDEPLLIATHLPELSVWSGQSKSRTVQVVDSIERPDVIIVDDGYQHWRLTKDLDIVLLDAELCIGNGSPLPIGPLREPPSALYRADVIVIVGSRGSNGYMCVNRIKKYIRPDSKVFYCHRRIEEIVLSEKSFPVTLFQAKRCLSFAGIAYPERFFSDLEKQGLLIVRKITFPDHYIYSPGDVTAIFRQACSVSAQVIITTEKDFVRIPEEFKKFIAYAKLSISGRDVFETLGSEIKRLRELKTRRGGKDVSY